MFLQSHMEQKRLDFSHLKRISQYYEQMSAVIQSLQETWRRKIIPNIFINISSRKSLHHNFLTIFTKKLFYRDLRTEFLSSDTTKAVWCKSPQSEQKQTCRHVFV